MSDDFREHVEIVRECLHDAALFDVSESRAGTLTSIMRARGLLADHPPDLDPNRVMSAVTFLLHQVHASRRNGENIDADDLELAAQSMRQGLRGRDTGDGGNLGSKATRLHDAMFEMVRSVELSKIAQIAEEHDSVESVVDLIRHFADIHREVAINVDVRTGELYPINEEEDS